MIVDKKIKPTVCEQSLARVQYALGMLIQDLVTRASKLHNEQAKLSEEINTRKGRKQPVAQAKLDRVFSLRWQRQALIQRRAALEESIQALRHERERVLEHMADTPRNALR